MATPKVKLEITMTRFTKIAMKYRRELRVGIVVFLALVLADLIRSILGN